MQKDSPNRRRWTRKAIIQEIVQREAEGLPLSASRRDGVDTSLYQAARRLFGSWQKALLTAGVAPERAMPCEKWPPQKIINTIRHLAKRKRPVNIAKISKRYSGLVPAARRVFGSWTKALAVAGVDPTKFSCPAPWTRERVIEEILTRALRNEPLGSRTTDPRALVYAGQKFYGTWRAAKKAAGIGTCSSDSDQTEDVFTEQDSQGCDGPTCASLVDAALNAIPPHIPGKAWTTEMVLAHMRARLEQGERLNAAAVHDDDRALYRAATRRFGNWTNALIALGLNPNDYYRRGKPPYTKSLIAEVSENDDAGTETERSDASAGS